MGEQGRREASTRRGNEFAQPVKDGERQVEEGMVGAAVTQAGHTAQQGACRGEVEPDVQSFTDGKLRHRSGSLGRICGKRSDTDSR